MSRPADGRLSAVTAGAVCLLGLLGALTGSADLLAAAPAEIPGLAVPVPAAWPEPAVPAANPYTAAKAELGRYLFYDRRLSVDGSLSCGGCHRQALAFTDGRPRGVGATGEHHRRNTLSLTNVVYNRVFNWADADTTSLEEQMRVPLFGRHPLEMGLDPDDEALLRRLAAEPPYPRLFAVAFPDDLELGDLELGDLELGDRYTGEPSVGKPAVGEPKLWTMQHVVRAIATFVRSLISSSSSYDRYVSAADPDALTPGARRGLELFFSDRLSCSACHGGWTFAGNVHWFARRERQPEFHNTSLYDLGSGAYPVADQGLIEASGEPRDMGRFRAPTLRNIELTAPYMHDGSMTTLREVIEHYDRGGRAGPSPLRSDLVKPLNLTSGEVADLLEFLISLTDEAFVSDPRLSDPWPPPAVETEAARH